MSQSVDDAIVLIEESMEFSRIFFDNIFSYFPRKFFANAKISDFGPKNGILKMIQKIRILKMVQKKGSKIRILYIYKKWNSKNILKE